MEPQEVRRKEILHCVAAIRDDLPSPFILVGGAAVISLGSLRITEDVDILVPSNTTREAVYAGLQAMDGFRIINGKPSFESNTHKSSMIKIDILTTVD
jgi:hypothetical protein